MRKSFKPEFEQTLLSKAIVLKEKFLWLKEQSSREVNVFRKLYMAGLMPKTEYYDHQEFIRLRYNSTGTHLEDEYFETMLVYYHSNEYASDYSSLHKNDYKVSVKKLNEIIKKLTRLPESKEVKFSDFRVNGGTMWSSPKYFLEDLRKLKTAYQKSPKRYTLEDAKLLDRDPWMQGINGIEWGEMKVSP